MKKPKNSSISTHTVPLALLDELAYITDILSHPLIKGKAKQHDYQKTVAFLKSYKGSQATFNAYRREIEKLLQWSWQIQKKSLKELRREDIEAFIYFCQKPPASWIGLKKAPRFIEKDNLRISNPDWRPFVATVTKSAHRQGKRPTVKQFKSSVNASKTIFAILSTFFQYLLQETYISVNPVSLIRQKSQFIQKQQGPAKIRRLSESQWQMVIKTAQEMAEFAPAIYERTLFMMTALYAMYLRISELAANIRWIPLMQHFYKDSQGYWWFVTVGKGNKQRQIAVSDVMLSALKRWRKHLGLSLLPSPADSSFLLPKTKGHGAISSTTYIRDIVQLCFDKAIDKLREKGMTEEAENLGEATVHRLRHTGISDDVKRRPREHVRDDAGHGSSAITDKYIDIELKARHRSAKHKPLMAKN